jgi:carboxypeptidase Taq
MADTSSAYGKLVQRSKEIALVESAAHLLSWDQETNMPPAALRFRADQLAFLSGWSHRQFTAPEVGSWLAECEQGAPPADGKAAANLREWRRAYARATRLPPELVEEFERVRTIGREAWIEARRKAEFALFQPHLQKIVDLSRRMTDLWGYEDSPYDALLDAYEPKARAREIRALFQRLKPELVALVARAAERSRSIPENLLEGQYPIAAQQAFNKRVAEAFGFDFSAGRIDTTTHPFCTGLGPGDCRLTTRYRENDFTDSFYSVLHEVGHGLYEQGLPAEHFGTPAGAAVSLGIHESQSRLWENHIGRSRAFWEHWHPIACEFLGDLKRFSVEQIWTAVNRVSPSFIRVEADEVTYDLHIVLRFEVEMRLVTGELKIADLPAFWNEEFHRLFGLKVPNDAQGCLQDIHWSLGSLGYFPTYTLGNLNASQLMRRIRADSPGLDKELASGQYGGLLQWLRRNVHAHGQQFTPGDLMERATGEATDPQHHLEYLRSKFGSG